MLLMIFLVLAFVLIMAFLPGRYLTEQVGGAAQMGPRDDLPEPTRELSRSRRALANLHETLPIFLTLAVLSLVLGEEGTLPIIGAAIYLIARIAHAYCYVKALSPWRSIAFLVSLIGMGLIALPQLPHIWG